MAVLLLLPVMFGAACSDDAGTGGGTIAAVTLPATVCATGDFDAGRTIVVHDDDLVGGFGSFGTRTPSDLAAGTVRISVEADAENAAPANVTVTLDGQPVTAINGVAAGSTCGVDVDLVAGHYELTNGQQSAGFDIVAG
jgi:hypothetical protein